MTRDDIYDHLAQVYLGKRKEVDVKKKRQFNVWLFFNVVITMMIFASAFYGLTAFLTSHDSLLKDKIFYSLHRGPIRIEYNFKDTFQPVEKFSLNVPEIDASRYDKLNFSVRSKEEGSPGRIKIVFSNVRNESAYYYVQGIGFDWKKVSVPLSNFYQITDWTALTDVSFILESWNVDDKKGVVLIDDLSFAFVDSTDEK